MGVGVAVGSCGRWHDEFVAANNAEDSHDCDDARGCKGPQLVLAWDVEGGRVSCLKGV